MNPDPETINRAYYTVLSPGRLDYWKHMAAPRFRIATILRFLEEMPTALKLVDLGCGSGELLNEIRGKHPGYELCGIDLSSVQIQANRGESPEVEWWVLDLDGLEECPPGLAGRFDVVIASEVLEHVERPTDFLRNALAMAKPTGGRMLLSTQSGRVWETERCVGHRRHFGREEMTELLTGAGWRPDSVWNAGYPFHDWAKRLANLRPAATMAAYSGNAYTPLQRFVCWVLRLAYRLNSGRRGAQLFAVARRLQDQP